MPSWSGATPILVGERIFVMSPSAVDAEELKKAEEERQRREQEGGGRGRRGGGPHAGGQELQLLCLEKEQGSVLWTRTLDRGNRLYMKGNETSPSPVSDGKHVWAITGTGKVSALDMDGKLVWQRDLQADYGKFGHNWGYACSPLLHDGKLVVEVLHGSHTDDASYLVAFDALTGEPKWRVERPTDAPQESPDAYTTPLLVQHMGQTQIVISGGDCVTGHDPATGKELWRVDGLNPRAAGNYRIVASPLVVDGMVYAPTRVRPLTAIALGEKALPTDEDIAWQWDDRGGPDVPTPTCDGKYFYMIDDGGRATCLDAKTGAVVWGPERTVEGTVSSSPLLADGRIYFTTEEGITVVLKAGEKFELLAANELDGSYTLSSPIASGDRLFIRTGAHLYCLGG
jgi:outer membrane protein assembly factor BamB